MKAAFFFSALSLLLIKVLVIQMGLHGSMEVKEIKGTQINTLNILLTHIWCSLPLWQTVLHNQDFFHCTESRSSPKEHKPAFSLLIEARFSHGSDLIKHLNIDYCSKIEMGWSIPVVCILMLTSNIPKKWCDVGEAVQSNVLQKGRKNTREASHKLDT